MFHIEILVILVFALFLVIVEIQKSFVKSKIQIKQLTLVLINVFLVCLFWLFYDEFNQYVKYSFIGLELLLFSIIIFLLINESKQKSNCYNRILESLNNTSFNVFYICDKKERIKEISSNFLDEIGLRKEEVLGKKAFDIFDHTIRITKVNDHVMTNKELRDYYKTFGKTVDEKEEFQREIYFQNCNGQTVVYNLVEKPLFESGKYWGRLNIGQKKNDASLVQVEKDLLKRNKDLESIQYKFIAALELTEEGFFYNNLDENYLWQNDNLVKELGLYSSTISALDYRNFIHPDDLPVYTATLQNLSPENPTYSLTYRFKVGSKYEFVKESGKRIFEDSSENVIVGFARKVVTNSFMPTHTDIDKVKGIDEMVDHLDNLYNNHRIFQLVCISLSSIPEINNQYGRKVGDMIMDEYIRNLKNNFLTENSDIYRASGIVFYFTITDLQKMEMFKKSLKSDDQSMNLTMHYGSMKAILSVNIGIAEAFDDSMNKDELIKNCNAAINVSLNPNYRLNYAYYKDIKNITMG